MATAAEHTDKHPDYDSPWKEVLERYFKEFMQFFFPTAYRGIEWSKPYEFLDKELQQIVRDAELGRRLVDKLVKVLTTEGDETWVVVHVEVQGEAETDFARRMYIYNYRLFDRYDRRIISLAVLADDRKAWRPNHFGYALWGYELSMQFPIVKLLDYGRREAELEVNPNPFAIVVLAYLKTRVTRRNPEDRLQWKLRLVKLLYKRGYGKDDILELLRFIDWIMVLPDAFAERFDDEIVRYEEEQKMQYVTTFERIGIKKGREEGRQEGREEGWQEGRQEGFLQNAREAVVEILQIRFESVPENLVEAINAINDLEFLKHLHRSAVTIGTLETFAALATQQKDT